MFVRLTCTLLALSLVVAGCTAHRGARKPMASAHTKVRHTASVPRTGFRGQVVQPVATHYASQGANGEAYALGSGDRVRITVFGQENLSRVYPVDGGGYVSMPLVGAISAGGSTTFQLEERIAQALKQKYVKDPKVSVEIETYRPFFILGEVRNGGQFPYVAGMTVQTAVAIAGGFTARAKKSSVQLSRQVNGRTFVQMVPPTWKVQPGDTIAVKERFL